MPLATPVYNVEPALSVTPPAHHHHPATLQPHTHLHSLPNALAPTLSQSRTPAGWLQAREGVERVTVELSPARPQPHVSPGPRGHFRPSPSTAPAAALATEVGPLDGTPCFYPDTGYPHGLLSSASPDPLSQAPRQPPHGAGPSPRRPPLASLTRKLNVSGKTSNGILLKLRRWNRLKKWKTQDPTH